MIGLVGALLGIVGLFIFMNNNKKGAWPMGIAIVLLTISWIWEH